MNVYQLLLPNPNAAKSLAAYESAAKAVIAGKWPEVRQYLHRFSEDGGPANFLWRFPEKAPE